MNGGRAQLSPNFALAEFLRSAAAERAGIPNVPDSASVLENLRYLSERVLEPLRSLAGASILVTSGYRSPALNSLVGGARNSQHLTGEAADVVPANGRGVTVADLFALSARLELYDQIIYELNGEKEWLHVSVSRSGRNRYQRFTLRV